MRLIFHCAIATVTSGLCMFSPAHAATPNTLPAPSAPHTAVGKDSEAWRRSNPFIDTGKSGTGPALTKPVLSRSVPLKSGAKSSGHFQDGNLNVQGIMQADRKFHALINGRAVKAGDVIDGYTVKEIHRYNVVLLNERKEKIIYDIYQGRIDRGKK